MLALSPFTQWWFALELNHPHTSKSTYFSNLSEIEQNALFGFASALLQLSCFMNWKNPIKDSLFFLEVLCLILRMISVLFFHFVLSFIHINSYFFFCGVVHVIYKLYCCYNFLYFSVPELEASIFIKDAYSFLNEMWDIQLIFYFLSGQKDV